MEVNKYGGRQFYRLTGVRCEVFDLMIEMVSASRSGRPTTLSVEDQLLQKIVCVPTGNGKPHDFALFKSSRLALAPHLELLADTGYQAMDKLHANSRTPYKHHPLTPEQKQHNTELASRRITTEYALRFLKCFRILSSTYRNRRKRFGMRLNLIAAIANLHKLCEV